MGFYVTFLADVLCDQLWQYIRFFKKKPLSPVRVSLKKCRSIPSFYLVKLDGPCAYSLQAKVFSIQVQASS